MKARKKQNCKFKPPHHSPPSSTCVACHQTERTSDQTSSAYKKLASIFKTASTETERATKELFGRLTQVAEGGGGLGGEGEAEKEAAASPGVASAGSMAKAKQVERIKRLQVGSARL